MNINNNFVGSRMNKSLDERLIGPGDYIDALNIRISSDEDGEAGSAENSKGNIELAAPMHNGAVLANAKCIGVFEDGTNETIYWFVTSPTVDMILSYNVENNNLIYHIVSDSVLNFSEGYPINSINLVDNLLFFTDNYNAPRKINIRRGYPESVNGYDLLTEDDISVIVKPPLQSPQLSLRNTATIENYLEDKFIRFAYRYEYADGEYSALSEFSDLAFSPGVFEIDYSDYAMIGMRNRFNVVDISFDTGSKHVKGIDLCFKQSNSNVVAVVQKFNKTEEGWGNNLIRSISFNNKKIYTTLPESELLRMFDNVPRRANQQTIMGNRLMYGNYIDGYNIDTNLDYELELISTNASVGEISVTESTSAPTYSTNFTLNFGSAELKEGMVLFIDINALHNQFAGAASYPTSVQNDIQKSWSFRLPQDYDTVTQLATSTEFLSAIELTGTYANSDQGFSMSDIIFTSIVAATVPVAWEKVSLVKYDIFGASFFDSEVSITNTSSSITFQLPGVKYQEISNPGVYAYEFFSSSATQASIADATKAKSLHSNRGYEVAVEYLDEYERASTALVSTGNTIFVNSEQMVNQNKIRVSMNSLAPSWATRYRFVLKPSAGNYETIYANFYYQDAVDGGAWWIRLEGDNQTKAAVGDTLIVKSDSAGPTGELITTKILDIKAQERDFLSSSESAGLYMKVRANNFLLQNDPDVTTTDVSFTSSGSGRGFGTALSVSELVPGTGGNTGVVAQYRYIAFPTGTKVRFLVRSYRFGTFAFDWGTEQTFTAQNNYNNIHEFIQGENINFNQPYVNNGVGGISQGETNQAVWISSVGNSNFLAEDVSIGNPLSPLYTGRAANNELPDPDGTIEIKYYQKTGTEEAWLYASVLRSGTSTRPVRIRLELEIIQPGELIVFETEPEEVSDEIYYQSSKSYPVQSVSNSVVGNYSVTVSASESSAQTIQYNTTSSGSSLSEFQTFTIAPSGTYNFVAVVGSVSLLTVPESNDNVFISYTLGTYTGNTPKLGHYGTIQNQTTSQPAIIDLNLYNCFVFGNGVESYKIGDEYATPGFRIGARVTAVAEEDYKEANRYADITYSGVYNANTNLNKLNEFNLGLANYKSLEQSFGPINKLHGRQTDILVLQEDKISYVLGGKNLLSDAAAGGAIVSTPSVLGIQMARVDEIGISQDTESFAVEGSNTFFTDSKRGLVVNLTGGNSSEALNIISSLGMRSWFRDEFIDDINKIKLGAYDSYMDEYVLTFTDTERPTETATLGCGVNLSQIEANLGQVLNYEIEFEDVIGVCNIDYSFTSGSAQLSVVYGGTQVINQTISSTGSIVFNKDLNAINSAFVTITPIPQQVSPGVTLPVSYDFNFGCVVTEAITVISMRVNSSSLSGSIANGSYSWTQGSLDSVSVTNQTVLGGGPVSSDISETGISGEGAFPSNNSVVTMKHTTPATNLPWNSTYRLKYLSSNTLYAAADIATLLPLMSNATTVITGNDAVGTFTYAKGVNDYLYLVWDYN